MSKDIKKMLNEGFAISEHKMLRRLENFAKEGWILESMTALNFILRKGPVQDIQYSMDYQIEVTDFQEYTKVFESSGWQYVCHYGGFYIFKADKTAMPIHTDSKLLDDIRNNQKKKSVALLLFSVLGLVFGIILDKNAGTSQIISSVSFIISLFMAALLGMSIVLNYGWFFRKGK